MKRIVDNLILWREREKIHPPQRLKNSSFAKSSLHLVQSAWKRGLHHLWARHGPAARYNDWCWHQNAVGHKGRISFVSMGKCANFINNASYNNNKANVYQAHTTPQACGEAQSSDSAFFSRLLPSYSSMVPWPPLNRLGLDLVPRACLKCRQEGC